MGLVSVLGLSLPAGACKVQPGGVVRSATSGGPPNLQNVWDPGGTFSPLMSLGASNYDSDCEVWLTDDESEVFFVRMTGENGPPDSLHQGGWDIYHSRLDSASGLWSEAVNLGTNVNTESTERRPTTTADGDTLFFSRSAHIW